MKMLQLGAFALSIWFLGDSFFARGWCNPPAMRLSFAIGARISLRVPQQPAGSGLIVARFDVPRGRAELLLDSTRPLVWHELGSPSPLRRDSQRLNVSPHGVCSVIEHDNLKTPIGSWTTSASAEKIRRTASTSSS
jgi:hypothetical protein